MQDEFGITVDSLQFKDFKVKRNQSLYEILRNRDFSPRDVYDLSRAAKSVVNIKKIKPGQRYRVYRTKDSTAKVRQMVWQPNPVDYVVFDWSDSVHVYERHKKVTTRLRTASGVIQSSLFETLQQEDLSPMLAIRLSEIYAWEIDFFRIFPGDRFKVIYEEKMVDGKKLGMGKILAAVFQNRGRTYRAFRFDNGEKDGFYDQDGKSIQKALLKAPLKYSYISSGYSNNRYHPILHKRMAHRGIDYVAPYGSPVHSVGDGTVVYAGYDGPNGNKVKIRHNSTYTTTYIHLKGFAKGVRRGAHVKQGQTIGYLGNTGRSTGPHLDYRLYVNGVARNPRTIDLPPSKSVPDSLMPSYSEVSTRFQQTFDQIKYPNQVNEAMTKADGDESNEKDNSSTNPSVGSPGAMR